MPYGLKDSELEKICGVFASNERIERVVLYGSRAKGNYKPFSDVDITLMGEKLTHSDLNRISLAVDDLLLPYQFDISIFHTLKNEALIDHIQRIGITIYERESEWKEYKLGEIIQIIGGGTPKTSVPEYWDGDIPWLSVSDFNNGKKYVFTTEKHITQLGLNNSSTKLLHKDDIIISARGTVGVVAMIGSDMAFNQSCYGIRNKDLVDKQYLYYLLVNSVNGLKQNAYGGVFDTITRETFDLIDVSLPSLDEQRRISAILSSLDDKIDLLHRENATLEAMAETLFRQWFVEDAKEDWEEKTLAKCIKLVGGGTPKTSEENYWNGSVCWLSGGDIANNHKGFVSNSEKSITEEGLKNSSAKLLPENALVVSARGTVGKYCLLSKPMAFSQSNYGIMPVFGDCYFFTYLLVAYHIDELQSAAYGSVFDTITTKTFDGVSVKIPQNQDEIICFENKVSPYFEKIKCNNKQIQTLIQTRDELLPRLMSGEIKI